MDDVEKRGFAQGCAYMACELWLCYGEKDKALRLLQNAGYGFIELVEAGVDGVDLKNLRELMGVLSRRRRLQSMKRRRHGNRNRKTQS